MNLFKWTNLMTSVTDDRFVSDPHCNIVHIFWGEISDLYLKIAYQVDTLMLVKMYRVIRHLPTLL